MPSVGFGVFQIPVNETERIVTDALEAGYRMIDTAASYFNEEQVGNALRHSGLKREDVFVTTKLWVQDYEYDDALRAFDLSMRKLGLDYLDLYLLHKPYGNYYAAWRAAERLYREGRIRAIGVTSFSSERLQAIRSSSRRQPTHFSVRKAYSTRRGLRLRKDRTTYGTTPSLKPLPDWIPAAVLSMTIWTCRQ